MACHNKKTLHSILAVGLLSCTGLHAAQLGKLEVLSEENQTLLAEIKIEAVQPNERIGLKATIASETAFQAARLTMDPSLKSLKFVVLDGSEPGTALLRITSDKIFPAGFVDALIELSWAGGRVAREYTLNVPAKSPESVKKPEVLPPVVLPQTSEDKTNNAVQAKPEDTKTRLPTQDITSLRVKHGDTLSEIALQWVGKDVSLNQAMAAIYEANADAFLNKSVHLIKEGATLQIPNRAALIKKSKNEALLILAQNDDRNVYSLQASQLGLLTITEQLPQAGVKKPEATGSIDKLSESNPVVKKDADRLQIATGNAAGADQSAEELLAKNKALAEANERIALLEKNVSDLQRLLEMQNEASTPPAAPNSGLETPAEKSISSENAEAALPAVDVASEKKSTKPVPVEKNKASEPKKTVEKSSNEPENGSQWYLQTWFVASLGILAALAALAILLWKRRKSTRLDSAQYDPDSTAQSAENFDEALAWASAPSEEPTKQSVSAVESETFDLNELLDQETQPIKVDNKREPSTKARPEKIPDLNEESLEAKEQTNSLQSDVDLEFPEEDKKTDASILEDLDSLEKGANAAQNELDEMRKATSTQNEKDMSGAFDDLLALDEQNSDRSNSPDHVAAEKPPALENDFEKAVADLNLDVPNPAVDEATWQEVATKLDLAGAYVEIGDADGAKELLNEILEKGDVDQVRKAKALMANLG